MTRIEKGKWKERQQGRGFCWSFDTALTQLVNLPKAFAVQYHQGQGRGLQPLRTDVTAVTSEKKITRTVGSVKRRRSQGRRKRSWRWQRGKESERAMLRHSGRKSVDRRERGSAHRPQQLARLCSSVSGLAPALGLQGSHPSACWSANRGPTFVMLGDPRPHSPLHKPI